MPGSNADAVNEDPDVQLMESREYSSPEGVTSSKSGRRLANLFSSRK